MEFKVFNRLDAISKTAWEQITPADFPFYDYEFLDALENGGCLGRDSGWMPHYLTAWEDEQMLGACVLYEKDNSYGEYIFDWQWAEFAERAGFPYYPKLVSAVPFTPATGPKVLLLRESAMLRDALIAQTHRLCEKLNAHSIHALFISEAECEAFRNQGFLIRHTHQFHWQNDRYASFDDYLHVFARKKRQNINHERDSVRSQGLRLETLGGSDLKPEHATLMYQFYRDTIARNHAIPYLTQEFFEQIFSKFSEAIVLFLAFDGKDCVAGAINFQKGSALFGRYWGCKREYKNLHFELCYYQGIEFAITQRLLRFEAGAQGPHKINRGFLPAYTYSAHRFHDQRFHQLLSQAIDQENAALKRGLAAFAPHIPFKEKPHSSS